MLGEEKRKPNFHTSLYTLYFRITNRHNYQLLQIQIESNLTNVFDKSNIDSLYQNIFKIQHCFTML